MTPKNKTALASAISGQTTRRDFLKVTGLVGGGLACCRARLGARYEKACGWRRFKRLRPNTS